ncbi:hypothetical protein [Streptomyces silvisoli]|uniref:HNH endonuclease n=1 Tax=Streptomyces silvisoli TaxID=3034235 RepID=A0ABT5ZTA5_9ACTN|nr:hypothetical protein [Streptomyces silvisoli]MDF3293062.1 hypothetical protein [Streptomyces silvisoli]
MTRIHQLALFACALTLVSAGVGYGARPAQASTASCSQSYLPLPDPSCTPGAYNPDVTQDTIDSTICVSGWTSTVRPPASYTNRLKVQQIAAYGYSDTSTADYEEDHLVPLELGGAPKDPNNLWPEPRYDAGGGTSADKDKVENDLKRAVCNDTVTLDEARQAIANDWTTAESSLGLN